MNITIFCKRFIGGEAIIQDIQESLSEKPTIFYDSVDLSKLDKDADNLIIVINKSLLNFDFAQFLSQVKIDTSRPIITVSKLKTFGAVFFDDSYHIKSISTNKIYPFAGVIYLPKGTMKNTFSETLSNLDINTLKYTILKGRSGNDK
jgi:hypothetical protein